MYKDFTKYEVYDDGRIWSYSRKKFLKPKTEKNGYQTVCLVDNNGNKKYYYLHRVVWEAVTSSTIPDGMQINHRSEVKTENMITNLELVSPKQNCNFGTRNARIVKKISKQVGAYKDGKLVMTFSSTNEAGRQGFNQQNVSACCNGKLKHHKGYEWRYL